MNIRRCGSQTAPALGQPWCSPPNFPGPIQWSMAPHCAATCTPPILGLTRAVTAFPRCQRLGRLAKTPRISQGGLPHFFGLHLWRGGPAKGGERSCGCWWLRDTCHGTDLPSPSTHGKNWCSPSTAAGRSAGRERGMRASNPVFNKFHRVLGRFSPKTLRAALLGKEGGYI